jgi:hypothetical protein
MRARLKEPGGFEAEDFTENTRPTNAQVATLLARGHDAVSSRIGTELCQDAVDRGFGDQGTELAAIYVAMVIEQSYYPEQTRNQGSSFQSLMQLWKEGIGGLEKAVKDVCGTDEGGGAGQQPHSFFDDEPLFGRTYPLRW